MSVRSLSIRSLSFFHLQIVAVSNELRKMWGHSLSSILLELCRKNDDLEPTSSILSLYPKLGFRSRRDLEHKLVNFGTFMGMK